MLVIVYEFTLHNILEDLKLHQQHCEDCVSCIDYISLFLNILFLWTWKQNHLPEHSIFRIE